VTTGDLTVWTQRLLILIYKFIGAGEKLEDIGVTGAGLL